MENTLLAVHVLAGILFVGPVAVTTSLFPRFAPRSVGAGREPEDGGADVARLLHRITRTYGVLALVVPLVGLALAAVQGRLGEIWITVAMVLTAVAGGLLALRIVPAQRDALIAPLDVRGQRGMRMLTGVFNVLWAVVVVLMIVRPGAE
ncbi:hypothetical protein [Microbacterium saperdae]|uniref:Uncharacterized protein n=1 Tax=Microbacterium saperdae TaxID=69368 RepID=A0A543BAC4_9MICO|nr:hypothetical protein [Microbacterium saperdae]TQL81746.1 hypothetical protein FB560_3222 [Microbacterium saperdae]GGM34514.1 membrane protein [Microbacterium saperdae]